MCGAFSHMQTPRLLRDRRVCYHARNYILARKVTLRRTDNLGPLDLVGWRLNQVLQKAANQWSIGGVSHRTVFPWYSASQIISTNQVISPPVQQQDPLTVCYNPADNYPRALLWVARTNLVLQLPVPMPWRNLGAPGL